MRSGTTTVNDTMPKTLHQLTPRPPLGWNSYDSFGCFVNERRALENLRVFVERLKPHGYEYFVIDAGWYKQYELAGREFPVEADPCDVLLDGFGRPVPAPCFFPRGIKPLADACHAAGAKFGIHMMRGIPRAAVEANTPIKGTAQRARDIADPGNICKWCPDNYGIDMRRPGAQAYYNSVIALLAEWGVDFIKYDDIVPSPPEVEAVANAIGKCGRDMVLSLSPGNEHRPDGWLAYTRANLVRTTGDVWDYRICFDLVFDRWREFQSLLSTLPPGCWLDQDMIPFGELQVWRPEGPDGNVLMYGSGKHRMSFFNSAQKRSFMAQRALAASPLFMGGNLPGTDEESFRLITDPEMLACNQNGIVGRPACTLADKVEVWMTPRRGCTGSGWFGIFNRNPDQARDITVSAAEIGIPPGSRLFDIWNRRDLGIFADPLRVTLGADDVLFARYGASGGHAA